VFHRRWLSSAVVNVVLDATHGKSPHLLHLPALLICSFAVSGLYWMQVSVVVYPHIKEDNFLDVASWVEWILRQCIRPRWKYVSFRLLCLNTVAYLATVSTRCRSLCPPPFRNVLERKVRQIPIPNPSSSTYLHLKWWYQRRMRVLWRGMLVYGKVQLTMSPRQLHEALHPLHSRPPVKSENCPGRMCDCGPKGWGGSAHKRRNVKSSMNPFARAA